MATLLPRRTVVQFPPCHIPLSRWKYTLSFKHDPVTQSLVFYCRDGLISEGNKFFREAFEDCYLNAIGKKLRIRKRHQLPGAQPVDYRRMDPQVAACVLEQIGRMPRHREFTVCAINKLFHDHRAFQVSFCNEGGALNDLRLRPGRLFETLLGQAFEEKGRLEMEDYRRLRRQVLAKCYVRHGIEVNLRWIKGLEQQQKRYVVFPKKITRREIRRCLVKAGIRMRLVRVRIIRPNPSFYNFLLGKRLPTRCTIFPAGTERTRRKRVTPYRRPKIPRSKPLD